MGCGAQPLNLYHNYKCKKKLFRQVGMAVPKRTGTRIGWAGWLLIRTCNNGASLATHFLTLAPSLQSIDNVQYMYMYAYANTHTKITYTRTYMHFRQCSPANWCNFLPCNNYDTIIQSKILKSIHDDSRLSLM